MAKNVIVQIIVLLLVVGGGAWWYMNRSHTSVENSSTANEVATDAMSQIAPVSVSDSFRVTNPFDKAKINPLEGYVNPFEN